MVIASWLLFDVWLFITMLKRNLFFLFSITLFAIASLVLDVFNYNPYESSRSVFINFYTSLLFSLAGLIALVIYYIKFTNLKGKPLQAYFWPSIRQGLFLALSIVVLLVLKGLSLLDWWIGTSTVLVLILLELFFQTKKVKNKPDTVK